MEDRRRHRSFARHRVSTTGPGHGRTERSFRHGYRRSRQSSARRRRRHSSSRTSASPGPAGFATAPVHPARRAPRTDAVKKAGAASANGVTLVVRPSRGKGRTRCASPSGALAGSQVQSQAHLATDLLILAAFEPELAPLSLALGPAMTASAGGLSVAARIAGIGLAAAAAGAAVHIGELEPRAVVLVGTCGAYAGRASRHRRRGGGPPASPRRFRVARRRPPSFRRRWRSPPRPTAR